MTGFKIGDIVDVIDRRDGETVERGTKITKLAFEPDYVSSALDGGGQWGWVATLEAGYRVSVRCLKLEALP